MDRATVDVYEQRGEDWAARRTAVRKDDAVAFGRRMRAGGLRLDVGSGSGRYTNELGEPVVALDAARTMLTLLGDASPRAWRVQADLERLPFAAGSFAGAWANMCYQHVQAEAVPMALADLHHALEVDAVVDLQVLHGDYVGHDLPGDDLGGRFFVAWREQRVRDVLVGAGFTVESVTVDDEHDVVRAVAHRARTLADTVGAGMRVLVCGLNPSIYSADRGVGYARPGNRFWPTALEAGLVTRVLDTRHALAVDRVGVTDLCKRATVASAELTREEYVEGAARVQRLVEWLQPRAVLFVGLEGWRKAIDRSAVAGVQPSPFGGRPAYVMPSTSGLNASTPRGALVEHIEAALRLADAGR